MWAKPPSQGGEPFGWKACKGFRRRFWEALAQSQVRFNRVPEKAPGGSGRLWCRARSASTGFRRRFRRRFWEALVQSQVRFNSWKENLQRQNEKYASVVSPTAVMFDFYKSFWSVLRSQALETLLNLLNLTWPCTKDSQSFLRDLLCNLLQNPLRTWLGFVPRLAGTCFRFGVEIRFWSCNLLCVLLLSSIVFCNSVSADRSGMAASRFLAAAAACRTLLMSFAAENRKAENVVAAWRLRMVLWQQVFLNFGASCVAASLCKSLLCVKASLCKSSSV